MSDIDWFDPGTYAASPGAEPHDRMADGCGLLGDRAGGDIGAALSNGGDGSSDLVTDEEACLSDIKAPPRNELSV